MSGGSYDYLYSKIEDAAHSVTRRNTPLRKAFAAHLIKVADAMRAVEWVDSCDSSPGTEDAAIRACIAEGAELEAAKVALEAAMKDARDVLGQVGVKA